MRRPGIEPGPPRWQRGIIATRLMAPLTGRIRTIDLGITIVNFYSPPLYQLSYGELHHVQQNFWNHRCLCKWVSVVLEKESSRCQCVRVVKEPDLKSGGLCPRRFKSCS